MNNYGLIYCITNTVNGKKYVGQTTIGLKRRYDTHLQQAFKTNNQGLLYRAFRKYGRESFKLEALACCDSKETLDDLEDYFVDSLKSRGEDGYNVREKGSSGKHSEETRQKIRENRGKPVMTFESHYGMGSSTRGKARSPETRAKISASHMGKILSEETRKNIGLAGLGRVVSQETREKIRAAHKGKKRPPEVIAKMKATFAAKRERAV